MNLHISIDTAQLYETFQIFGEIVDCKVSMDNAGVSKQCGVIRFATPDIADLGKACVTQIVILCVVLRHLITKTLLIYTLRSLSLSSPSHTHTPPLPFSLSLSFLSFSLHPPSTRPSRPFSSPFTH